MAAERVAAAAVPTAPSSLPADWAGRLRRGLAPDPDHRPEHTRCGTRIGMAPGQEAAQVTHAAVLVPIVLYPRSPALLLTVRARHLRSHAGQVSFPGGRLEPGDPDLASAALRETSEEIGVSAGGIEPLGFMADQIVRSGYRISPLVALLKPGFTLSPSGTEVAEVFELPLLHAASARNYHTRTGGFGGPSLEVWELPFEGRRIWGATAGMLANLRELLWAEGT